MKIFSSTIFKKFIVIFLVVVVLFTTVGPDFMIQKAYAEDAGGILAWPLAKFLRWIANAIQGLYDDIFGFPFTPPGGTKIDHFFISSIVYGDVPQFDVNIFNSDTSVRSKAALNSTIVDLIAKYYGFTRALAIAASLVILIYVGIRILISTAAGELTKYKSLLKDWVLALVLVIAMHYIMSITLFACDTLTDMFKNLSATFTGGKDPISVINTELTTDNSERVLIFSIVQIAFSCLTFVFILIYAKRVLMISFLTIVGPLVGISYAVDKIKDGQSQILDKWLKEYVYTALVMPLDALLFSIVSSMVMTMLNASKPNVLFALALIIGYIPLRGWFTEFIGADKAGHVMGAAAAGMVAGKMLGDNGSSTAKRKGSNVKGGKDGGDKVGSGDNDSGNGIGSGGNRPGLNSGATGSAANYNDAGGDSSSSQPEASSYNTSSPGSAGGSSVGASGLSAAAAAGGGSLAKYLAKTAVKKAGRGALNMGENAAARTYGIAKGALKASAAMLVTGNAGFAAQRGLSGYKSGTNAAVGKMDSIEKGTKNAAVVAGTFKDSAMGSNKKREELASQSEGAINLDYNNQSSLQDSMIEDADNSISGYNSQISDYNSQLGDLETQEEGEAIRAAQLQSYSTMSADEFSELSGNEREQAISAIRETVGDEWYNENMEGFEGDTAAGEKLMFQNAQDMKFQGAKDNNVERTRSITAEKSKINDDRRAVVEARKKSINNRNNSVNAKQDIEAQRKQAIESNKSNYSNMSRANVNRQYKSSNRPKRGKTSNES